MLHSRMEMLLLLGHALMLRAAALFFRSEAGVGRAGRRRRGREHGVGSVAGSTASAARPGSGTGAEGARRDRTSAGGAVTGRSGSCVRSCGRRLGRVVRPCGEGEAAVCGTNFDAASPRFGERVQFSLSRSRDELKNKPDPSNFNPLFT